MSGIDNGNGLFPACQIQGNRVKLKRPAPLKKQDIIIVRHVHQLAQIAFGLILHVDVK